MENRPGAVGILEGKIGGKLVRFVNYSVKKTSKLKERHKLVSEWLTEVAEETLRKRGTHGKCAEPVNISEFLFEAEKILGMPKNRMTIEQARELLEGSVSLAKKINNDERPLTQGLNKSACRSCNPLLKYFNIKEIINH